MLRIKKWGVRQMTRCGRRNSSDKDNKKEPIISFTRCSPWNHNVKPILLTQQTRCANIKVQLWRISNSTLQLSIAFHFKAWSFCKKATQFLLWSTFVSSSGHVRPRASIVGQLAHCHTVKWWRIQDWNRTVLSPNLVLPPLSNQCTPEKET